MKPTEIDNSGSDSDDDMEKAMAKEASQIKDTKQTERRFQNVDCKAKNCIFIKTNVDSPCDLAHAIFTDLEEKKVQKARYAIRMMPVSATCKAVMKNIEETAERIFKPYFETEFGEGLKYTSVCKIRNNQSISRMAILPNLGRIIREMNPLHVLCYDEPDLVILVEIIRNICCLSVIKDFFRFKKYNLHEVVKTPENGAELQTERSGSLNNDTPLCTDSSKRSSEEDVRSTGNSSLDTKTENSEDKKVELIAEAEHDKQLTDVVNVEKSAVDNSSKLSEEKYNISGDTVNGMQCCENSSTADLNQSESVAEDEKAAAVEGAVAD